MSNVKSISESVEFINRVMQKNGQRLDISHAYGGRAVILYDDHGLVDQLTEHESAASIAGFLRGYARSLCTESTLERLTRKVEELNFLNQSLGYYIAYYLSEKTTGHGGHVLFSVVGYNEVNIEVSGLSSSVESFIDDMSALRSEMLRRSIEEKNAESLRMEKA